MKRIFPWVVLVVLIILVTKILDMSIGYVRPMVATTLSPHPTPAEENHRDATSTVPQLSRSNLDNMEVATSTNTSSEFLTVVRVVDGDTIDVMEDGVTVRVRLIGINTPETVDPRRTVECFGKEASRKIKDLLSSGVVRLVNDKTQDTHDKYGRRLAYIYTPDGTLVNFELIQQGYAYEYTYRIPYEYQAKFKEAQRDAREGQRGLWAPGVCDTSSHTLSK